MHTNSEGSGEDEGEGEGDGDGEGDNCYSMSGQLIAPSQQTDNN